MVLAHVIGWPQGGFVGVDVFFVVSGYLITGLLLREVARDGRISLRTFYARRIRRILPASLLVLVVVAAVAFVVFNRARADQTLGDAIAAALLVSNWRFAVQGTDYFHAGDAVSPLQHFWTLSVEEQFYLVWPGLIVVAVLIVSAATRRTGPAAAGHSGGRRAARSHTRGRAIVAVVAVLVVGGSAAWAVVQTADDPTVAYFSTTTRAWELGAGALLTVASPLLARMPVAVGRLLGWAGLAAVVWSFLMIDPDSVAIPMPGVLLPVVATALVIAGGESGGPRQRHLFPLTNPVSVFVGDISYSLYLWHFPVLVFAAVLLPPGDATTLVILLVIALLSTTLYFMVEQPLHRSPWLAGRARSLPDEPTVLVEHPASPVPASPTTAVPVAGPALSSRPADWTPGTRYYPGARPRPAGPAPAGPVPAGRILAGPAPAGPQSDVRREAMPPEASRHPVSRRADAASGLAGTLSPWAAWRRRFAPRIGISAAALGIGAGIVVLILQLMLGPITFAGFASATPPTPTTSAAMGDADPVAAVQAELAAAISASAWPSLDPTLDQVIARSSSDNPAHDCFLPDVVPDLGRCTWGSPDAPRHMYLVGDSSAMAYAPAFKMLAETSGGAWRITTVGLYGCRFTDVLVDNNGAGVMTACPQRKSDVRAMIAANPADLVVVSNAYTLGHSVDGRSLSAADLLAATRAETSSYAAAEGVVYLAPPPHGEDLSRCYSPLTAPAACLSAVDTTWHDMQSAAEAVAAASGGHVIDALPFSCVQDVCPAFAGGLPIRYDDSHLTVAYAERITPVLRADLASKGLL